MSRPYLVCQLLQRSEGQRAPRSAQADTHTDPSCNRGPQLLARRAVRPRGDALATHLPAGWRGPSLMKWRIIGKADRAWLRYRRTRMYFPFGEIAEGEDEEQIPSEVWRHASTSCLAMPGSPCMSFLARHSGSLSKAVPCASWPLKPRNKGMSCSCCFSG